VTEYTHTQIYIERYRVREIEGGKKGGREREESRGKRGAPWKSSAGLAGGKLLGQGGEKGIP
jgi:hypothetical protein